jgi:hypothetical protein
MLHFLICLTLEQDILKLRYFYPCSTGPVNHEIVGMLYVLMSHSTVTFKTYMYTHCEHLKQDPLEQQRSILQPTYLEMRTLMVFMCNFFAVTALGYDSLFSKFTAGAHPGFFIAGC